MMHIFKIVFTITVIISTCDLTQAQEYGPRSQGDANLIKNGILAVVLKSTSEKELKKLRKKPDEAKAYLDATEGYNEKIKQVVTSEWNLSISILFISEAEARRLIEARDERYCLLEMGSYYSHEIYSKQFMPSTIGIMQIRSAAHPSGALIYCSIPIALYGTGVLTYCVQQLKNQILDYEKGIGTFSKYNESIESKTHTLQSKTLLFCDHVTENIDRLNANGRLKRIYPYPYEVVSNERLNEIITNKDERYAYALCAHNFQAMGSLQLFDYSIIDCKDGHPLFRTQRAGAALGFVIKHFTMDHLKIAVRRSKEKIK